MTEQQQLTEAHIEALATVLESVRMLELELYSDRWRLLNTQNAQEMSTAGILKIREYSRILAKKNPLVKRGTDLITLYTWAQGVTVSSKNEKLQMVIDRFMNSENNKRAFFGGLARCEIDLHLQEQGELFLQLFTNQGNGEVSIVEINADEITDIVCNPDNKTEPWFYKRTFTKTDLKGTIYSESYAYPDIHYTPTDKSKAGIESSIKRRLAVTAVKWEHPIYHAATNKAINSNRGIAEFYPANSWAIAYTRFLEDLASVWANRA